MNLRAAALNLFLRLTLKPLFAAPVSVQTKRRLIEGLAGLTRVVPPFTLELPQPGKGSVPPATWVSVGRSHLRKVILYFHGGAYVLGKATMYTGMLSELSRQAGICVCAPDYRLAPEAPFPAQIEDALACWEDLKARGYRPGDITIGGDSAGGGLALALLAELCGRGERPAGVFAFSPWTDLTGSGGSMAENRARDPILPASMLAETVGLVAGAADPANPRLSPLFARYNGAPPVLIQYSPDEILRDDALRMVEVLQRDGVRVVAEPGPGLPHVWQFYPHLLPQARAALARTADFIRQQGAGRTA